LWAGDYRSPDSGGQLRRRRERKECAPQSKAFWIWTLIDCLTKESGEGNDKLIWALVIIFTHFVGAALYFFIRRRKRKIEFGKIASG